MTTDTPGYPQHDPIDPGCPWVGPCQCYRDAAICNCGHNNGRHADTGAGPCACGCPTFTPATLTDRAHAHGVCLDHTPDSCGCSAFIHQAPQGLPA